MKESKEDLRMRFESDTNIVIDPYPDDWRQYAEWLENLRIQELNNKLLLENNLLRDKMAEAINVLEDGMSSGVE